jgi:glycosyltransferase involved in cell wall biosynthesis
MFKVENVFVKISIIIPFYNLEDYIGKCLDSVLEQDMPDFEIIAVDDGSTDKTSSLLEEYAKKDSRIKVLHLENGGLSYARNQGVSKSIGEYIMFLDGDDYILPGCFLKLYNYAKLNNADMVIFPYVLWENGSFGSTSINRYKYPKDTLMDSLTAIKNWSLSLDRNVINKIVKRNFFIAENIRFEEGRLCEDGPISCRMICKAQRIFYIDIVFYVYVQRNTSITKISPTFKRIYDHIYSLDCIRDEIKKAGYEHELTNILDSKYINDLKFMSYYELPKIKLQEEIEKSELFLKKRISEISYKRIFFNSYLSFKNKIIISIFKSELYIPIKIIFILKKIRRK